MNGSRAQDSPSADAANFILKLDSWLTCHNLTESFLIITNFLLLLKSSLNLVSVFNDSKSLIVDYNGSILLSDGFRWCFILVNIGILSGSLLCLMALLFASVPKTKLRLLKYFVITQLALAFIVLVLMGRLWFSPFKMELDTEAWKWTIRRYNYQFKPDTNGLWPNGLPLRTPDSFHLPDSMDFGQAAYDYRDKVDKLQQALGCCGVWSPNEWRQNELLGLLAPSCCLNPTRVDVEFPILNFGGGDHMNNETQPILVYNMKQIFYCQWGQNDGLGCQQHLNDKDTRFIFRLRLNLLLLIGILFLNVMSQALLKFEPIVDTGLVLQLEPSRLARVGQPSILPPSYEQSREFYQHSNVKYLPPSYQQTTRTQNMVYQGSSTLNGNKTPQQLIHNSLVTQDDLRLVEAIRSCNPNPTGSGGLQNPTNSATVLTMF